MNAQLLALILEQTPGIIALAKELFWRAHPDMPVPTDAEIIAAYQQALTMSLAIDQRWLDEHPPDE